MSPPATGCTPPAVKSGERQRNAEGQPQPLLILGWGKLGGGELELLPISIRSAWPEHGATAAAAASWITPSSLPAWQRLIKALDQPTQDGFVYRVDMRLRPFGDKGPLVPGLCGAGRLLPGAGAGLECYRDGESADHGR